jgi:hypothetical protein
MNRQNSRFTTMMAAAALAALGMAACGGGGGGGSSSPPPGGGNPPPGGGNPPPSGGIDGVGIAVGAITGFGSIFVNGVEFETTSAEIRIEDSPGTESELEIGDIVEVRGTVNDDGVTGKAEVVSFNDSVEGPVSSVDLAAGTLVVMGQTVRVTGSTVFDNSFSIPSLAGIQPGDVVEVSGFPNAAGEIVASRIEPRPAGGELELFGVVSALDANAKRFNITSTVVDYTTAQLDNGSPTNGACVEVKGSGFNGGVLTATRVEVKGCTAQVADGDLGEIEGVITRIVSSTEFEIGARRVSHGATTVFEGGTAADLRANLKVEAEGTFNASGVLVAKKVDLKPETSARLLGTIDSIGSSSLTLFGITVLTDAGTAYDDKSSQNVRPLTFADLRTGDYLEVRGFEEATAGTMTAVLVEREDLDTRREIRGTATDVSQPGFKVLGVAVTTNAATQYRDVNDAAISAATFFGAAANRPVQVRGTWNGTTFTAEEAELEN